MKGEMKMKASKQLLATFTILTFLFLISTNYVHADGPQIWTDKPDYSPGETVTIYGSGFTADATVTITIERPDGQFGTPQCVTYDACNP